jgi:hypothetical protein
MLARNEGRVTLMRCALGIGLLMCDLLLASCSSMGAFVGDNLPVWAGGLPKGTPPRPGTPGYREYLKSIGEETADVPAGPGDPSTGNRPPPPEPPPRNDTIDRPIH